MLQILFDTDNRVRKVLPRNNIRQGFTLINFLRKTINARPLGFTLIELLVVISIIAVLAVIAAVIFSGVQGRARDARRRADVTAIAKAYEANKVAGATTYPAPLATWFAGSVVPTEAATDRNYILVYSTVSGATVGTAQITFAPAWTAQTPAVNPGAVAGTTVATFTTAIPATVTSFQACGLLESPANTVFCRPNTQ